MCMSYVPYCHLNETRHTTFALHVYFLTFVLWGGGDGGGVTGDEAAKCVSQSESVLSALVSAKQLGPFKEN